MKRFGMVIAIGLALVAGIACWQRAQIMSWYCASRLAAADSAESALWAERVAELDENAIPWLLGHLRSDETRVCNNVDAALGLLARRWHGDDAKIESTLDALRRQFDSFSADGKQCALHFPLELLKIETGAAPSGTLTLGAGKLLEADIRHSTSDPASALRLAALLSERAPQGQWHEACHAVAVRGLQDSKPTNRVLAIHLSLNSRFAGDQALLTKIASLLRDDDPRVRRAALVAVGMSKDLAGEDELLPLLHDADSEVRRLCRLALRSRGLSDDDLVRAELISDERAAVRLQVFNHLYGGDDVEPGLWLQRLSQDSSPAVRAAAIRMASAQRRVELRERISEMARADTSPTVRQLAQHYLRRFGKN